MKKKKTNRIFIENDIAKIEIISPKYGKFFAIIDEDDIEKVKHLRWHVELRNNGDFYVAESNNSILLHRIITNCPKHLVVDHKNHNTLDNRKCNLKICTQKENLQNRKIKDELWGIIHTPDNKWHVKMNFDFCIAFEYNLNTLQEALNKKAELLNKINR